MKKLLLFIWIIVLWSLKLFPQGSNLVVFSENGERFFLIMNGLRQNDEARTNVRITSLTAPSYKVKVIFENPSLKSIDKTVYFAEDESVEATYVIKRDRKNRLVLRFMNQAPLANYTQTVPDQYVIPYHTTPLPPQADPNVLPQGQGGINVSVNDPNTGFNMNIGINSSGQQGNYPYPPQGQYPPQSQYPPQGQSFPPTGQYYNMPGYSGPIGCPWPLPQEQFESVLQSIRSKAFEDSRLTIAKQVIDANCLLSAQVKQIMLLFSFEGTRLELAKYAYGHTYDPGNYYMLNDAFTFESSIEELNNYIRQQGPAGQQIRPLPPVYGGGPAYTGPVGCPYPISAQQFDQVLNSIQSKSFDDSKLTIAKQVISSNCLWTTQVKQIMLLFSFESTRLELAKFAYGHTYDIGNYYMLNDAFSFESSIEELNNYIKGFKW
ncbi:MAG: DUF4476 domain-containing protein [Bacteroidales bacterium]